MLKQNETLTLSDNKTYSVVYKTKIKNKNYVYLIEQDNYKNTMFCEYNEDKLEEVVEQKIIKQLIDKFIKENS